MSALPSPPHWTNVRGRTFLVALVATAAVMALLALPAYLATGRLGLAQVVLPIWPAVVGAAGFAVQRNSAPRDTCDQHGTTLRPNTSADTVMIFGFMAFFILAALYAVLIFAGADMPPLLASPRGKRATPDFDAVLAGFPSIVMIPALLWAWQRRKENFLNLNPVGFTANEKPPKAARWDDVMDVLDFIPWADPSVDKMWPPAMTPIVFVMRDRSLIVVKSGSVYAPNGSAVFWMVRNYWRHPEQRGELLNGVALDRLAAEQFPAD